MDTKHNKKWYSHQESINKIYKDLIKYQDKHPEYDLSKQIGAFTNLLHSDLIDAVGVEDELF